MSDQMDVTPPASAEKEETPKVEEAPKPEKEETPKAASAAEEQMDTADKTEEAKKETPQTAATDEDKKLEQHTNVLLRGLRLVLGQFSAFQKATDVPLPDDVVNLLKGVLEKDVETKRDAKKANGAAEGPADGKEGGRAWTHARTAAMLERALANDVEGVVEKPSGVVVTGDVTFKAILDSPPPHSAMGLNFIRTQAVEFNEDLPLDGPFDEDKVKQPVELACKMEWFNLPKGCVVDFGKAEPYPGMKIVLGDPAKCGCSKETIHAFNKRPMLYKVLESVVVDMDRLGSFFSLLVESGKAELAKEGGDHLKDRMKPVFEDLDDICAMQCNRAAALFYLTCQISRGVALEESGLTGFYKNWQRLAHASKILFEHGKTDRMNMDVKAGKKQFPAGRGGVRGGGRGGRGLKRGHPGFVRGGRGGYGGRGGAGGGKYARFEDQDLAGPYGGRRY